DEGGPLIDGATHSGTIDIGDLDLWSFTANADESIVVRMGQVTDDDGQFSPGLRLYDPTGKLLLSRAGGAAVEVSAVASITGTYRLYLAKGAGPFVVGDDGGMLVGDGDFTGTIELGDLDMWSFCAAAGASIVVRMDEITDNDQQFDPLIRLYDANGALLDAVV